MKVAVITAPGRIELQEWPMPTPRPGWIVARVHAVGICGTDLETLEGTLPHLRTGRARYPIVPGHEWSGQVVAVGEGVTKFKLDDWVTSETHVGCGACEDCRSGNYNCCEDMQRVGIGDIHGACAEYITVPARATHLLPPSLDPIAAAVIEPSTVAFFALLKSHLQGGEHVVVVGPGAVGLLTVGLAKTLGAAQVTLLGTRDARLALGAKMGASATVNVKTNPQALAELKGTIDVVVDAAGNAEFFPQELALLRRSGVLSIVGFFRDALPGFDMNQIVTRNISVVGSMGSPGIWERMLALMVNDRFDPRPVVSHQFSLSEIEQAFQVAADKSSGAIKVLIKP